jgi:hypothetical protein
MSSLTWMDIESFMTSFLGLKMVVRDGRIFWVGGKDSRHSMRLFRPYVNLIVQD